MIRMAPKAEFKSEEKRKREKLKNYRLRKWLSIILSAAMITSMTATPAFGLPTEQKEAAPGAEQTDPSNESEEAAGSISSDTIYNLIKDADEDDFYKQYDNQVLLNDQAIKDPLYRFHGYSYASGNGINLNKAIEKEKENTTNTENVVAVPDTGTDYTNPDIAPNAWTDTEGIMGYGKGIHGYDCVTGKADPMPEGGDDHGTHVTGIIGAKTGNRFISFKAGENLMDGKRHRFIVTDNESGRTYKSEMIVPKVSGGLEVSLNRVSDIPVSADIAYDDFIPGTGSGKGFYYADGYGEYKNNAP